MLLAISNFIEYQLSTSSVDKWNSVWLSMDPGIKKLLKHNNKVIKLYSDNIDCLNVDSHDDISLFI